MNPSIWPPPTISAEANGWKVSFDFLSELADKVGVENGPVSLGLVEAMLLSLTDYVRNLISSLQYCQICGRTLDGYQQEDLVKRYDELLYAVASCFPGESRHETALRYIRQAETNGRYSCLTQEQLCHNRTDQVGGCQSDKSPPSGSES